MNEPRIFPKNLKIQESNLKTCKLANLFICFQFLLEIEIVDTR